ncbi:MAG TPA: thioredoxin family protein [Thermoanaerobaculia bacterium]|nr:thioredoxin family protein [Thermoanaerobaculia bacterium]
MNTTGTALPGHQVVSREDWLEARKAHLAEEKEFTRLRDELSRRRRELPWVKVDKEYVFDGPDGRETLDELFAGRSQLIVYHFMLAPGWGEGCSGCSFLVDHVDGTLPHLEHHDVSLVVVSRAPLPELEAFKKRMGWGFKWVSSNGSDFNYDYRVSFTKDELAEGEVSYNYRMLKLSGEDQPGISVFYKDEAGEVFHTYSSYERGGDLLIGTYNYLDLTPKGRNESSPMDWMRLHDSYDD